LAFPKADEGSGFKKMSQEKLRMGIEIGKSPEARGQKKGITDCRDGEDRTVVKLPLVGGQKEPMGSVFNKIKPSLDQKKPPRTEENCGGRGRGSRNCDWEF